MNKYSAVSGDAGADDSVYRPDQTHEPFEYENDNNQGRLTDDLDPIITGVEVVTLKRIFMDERWSPHMRMISIGTIFMIIFIAACLMFTLFIGLFKTLNAIDREHMRNHRGLQFAPTSNEGDAYLFFNYGGIPMLTIYSSEMTNHFADRYNSSREPIKEQINCEDELKKDKHFQLEDGKTCNIKQNVEAQMKALNCPGRDKFWGFNLLKGSDSNNMTFPDPCIFVAFQQPDNWMTTDVDREAVTSVGINCTIVSASLPKPYTIEPNTTVLLDRYMVLKGAELNGDDRFWKEHPPPAAIFRLRPTNNTLHAFQFSIKCGLVLNDGKDKNLFDRIFSLKSFAGLTSIEKRVILHKV